MKCKLCENEIKDNSRFCSYCGVMIETKIETIRDFALTNDQPDVLKIKDINQTYLNKEKGYYIVGLVLFGLNIFGSLARLVSEIYPFHLHIYLSLCVNLAIAAIPLLLSKYTTIKEHKNFLLIMGLIQILIVLGSSGRYLTDRLGSSLPFILGILLYATPFVLFIILLRKAISKTWGQIAIRYAVCTFYGIILVFSTMGMVVKSDYYGIAHLGIIISYPVVNLIIALVYRFIRRSSNKS